MWNSWPRFGGGLYIKLFGFRTLLSSKYLNCGVLLQPFKTYLTGSWAMIVTSSMFVFLDSNKSPICMILAGNNDHSGNINIMYEENLMTSPDAKQTS